jgi:hypothetical protein
MPMEITRILGEVQRSDHCQAAKTTSSLDL